MPIGQTIVFGAVFAAFLAGCSPTAEAPTPHEDSTPANNAAKNSPAPAIAIPTNPRTLAINVQGVAPVGLTLRIKSAELGTDATVLDVSASYGGTTTNNVELAGSPTYLLAENGDRLMLKAPQDNPLLNIVRGQTLDGRLVFLGAVASGTKSLKLVINDGNDGNSIIAPGLTIPIPLEGAVR